MKTRGILWISAGILIFALFTAWLRLPLASADIWMSPDETANMVSAIAFAKSGAFSFSQKSRSNLFGRIPAVLCLCPRQAWSHP